MENKNMKLIYDFMIHWNKTTKPEAQIDTWKTTEKSLVLQLRDGKRKIIPFSKII